jgi:hypothetical protein
VGNGFGCESSPPLGFVGERIGVEHAREDRRPLGLWLTAARNL